MNAKRCISCSQTKLAADFYLHPQMGDGRLNKCKPCCRRDALTNRLKNLERVRGYDRTRGSLPHRVLARRLYSRSPEGASKLRLGKAAWGDRNRHKRAAQWAVSNAVRDGRLYKPDHCERCGYPGKIEGHHPDYSKPLEVRWLCDPCHKQLHKELRAILRRA